MDLEEAEVERGTREERATVFRRSERSLKKEKRWRRKRNFKS